MACPHPKPVPASPSQHPANGTTQVMGTKAGAYIFQTTNGHECGNSWAKRPRGGLTAALSWESASQRRGSRAGLPPGDRSTSRLLLVGRRAFRAMQCGPEALASTVHPQDILRFTNIGEVSYEIVRNRLPGERIRQDKDFMGAFGTYECHVIENIFKK